MDKLLNAGWLTAEQAVRLLTGLFVMVLVARHLGPERFGAYAYLFALAGLFIPLALAGLDAPVMRRAAADPAQRDRLIGTALAIRGAAAVLAALLAFGLFLAIGGPPGTAPGLMAAACLVVLAAPAESFNTWFRAAERMAWIALPRIAVALAVAGVALVLVWRQADLPAFVALRAGDAGALGWRRCSPMAWRPGAAPPGPVARLARELLREGWPLLLGGVAVIVYMRIDQVMLGQMAGADELGLYSVAVRVSDTVLFVPMAVQSAFYAALVRVHRDTPGRFDAYMQRVYDAMGLAAWGCGLALGLAGWLLIGPVFGSDYSGAVPMLAILLFSLPAIFLGTGRGAMLTVRGWMWTVPAVTAAGAVANVALNLVLIPRWGGEGAAVATVLSYTLSGSAVRPSCHGCAPRCLRNCARSTPWARRAASGRCGAPRRRWRRGGRRMAVVVNGRWDRRRSPQTEAFPIQRADGIACACRARCPFSRLPPCCRCRFCCSARWRAGTGRWPPFLYITVGVFALDELAPRTPGPAASPAGPTPCRRSSPCCTCR
ncbi:MAG: flippase [Rhodobacteraceae bacterium]|nr:flippase [Paracoccaceae bacterium]